MFYYYILEGGHQKIFENYSNGFQNEAAFHFLELSFVWGLPEDKSGEDILKVLSCSVIPIFTLWDERSFMQIMGNS